MKKRFFYIVDMLNQENAHILKRALKTVPSIKGALVDPFKGIVEIQGSKDVYDELNLACDVAGAKLRRRAKLSEIS